MNILWVKSVGKSGFYILNIYHNVIHFCHMTKIIYSRPLFFIFSGISVSEDTMTFFPKVKPKIICMNVFGRRLG